MQQDPGALGRIGFTMLHGESCGEDHHVANKMALFLRCLLQSRLHSLLALSYSLPCKCAGLLHGTCSVRAATLKTLKAWWVRLQEVEEAATSDKWYQQLLVTLSWPVMQWPRRLLLALSEHDFEEVPSWVESQLQACARGFLSTKITEDMFHELQRRENASESDSLSRLQQVEGDLPEQAFQGERQAMGAASYVVLPTLGPLAGPCLRSCSSPLVAAAALPMNS